jgi:hypothetical protein
MVTVTTTIKCTGHEITTTVTARSQREAVATLFEVSALNLNTPLKRSETEALLRRGVLTLDTWSSDSDN